MVPVTFPAPEGKRRGRILLVDDQPMNIRLAHQILAQDYEILMATSGVQALEVCRKAHPDLILLDVVMPGMSGLEVCHILRQDPELRDTAVIFVTAGALADDENACWEAGGSDFVNKPVNPLTLRHRVHAHMQLKSHVVRLNALAFTDGLTGIANRRRFNEQLEQEWRRCVRNGLPIALLMIDVDFFKRYNDRYGHQQGDECLKRVAAALAAGVNRQGDLVARYGGEEFCCLLPATDGDGAMRIAAQLQEAIAALSIEHADSDAGATLSVSIGAATLRPDTCAGPELLTQQADRALYDAKKTGRARICLAA